MTFVIVQYICSKINHPVSSSFLAIQCYTFTGNKFCPLSSAISNSHLCDESNGVALILSPPQAIGAALVRHLFILYALLALLS